MWKSYNNEQLQTNALIVKGLIIKFLITNCITKYFHSIIKNLQSQSWYKSGNILILENTGTVDHSIPDLIYSKFLNILNTLCGNDLLFQGHLIAKYLGVFFGKDHNVQCFDNHLIKSKHVTMYLNSIVTFAKLLFHWSSSQCCNIWLFS